MTAAEIGMPSALGAPPDGSANGDVLILMPVFNDWVACANLLAVLDEVCGTLREQAAVLLVDDGSTVPSQEALASLKPRHLRSIEALRLRRNLGHQRAISVGLAFVEANSSYNTVVVMDSDGEDDPKDVARLLDASRSAGGQCVVFAERTRRSEGLIFKVFYLFFRISHFILTGHRVRVGNFSVVPRRVLSALVVVPEMWSHYAAAVFISRQPYTTIRTQRARRLGGASTMSFVSLVTHGLTAISVFSDVVGTRLLLASMLWAGVSLVCLLAVIAVRLLTDLAVPGWATYAAGLSLVLLIQAVSLAAVASLVVLSARKGATTIPARDYSLFVAAKDVVFSR